MIEEKAIKPIPYAVSDFNEIKTTNYYYIDKTRYIRKLEEKGRYLFMIRPRRFGKTLFVAMLETYYDINKKDQFDFFFKESDIFQNPTKEKNSYMVLTLDFSMVDPDISTLEASFTNYIQVCASEFIVKYKDLLNIDPDKADADFRAKKNASDVMVSLLMYCKKTKQKLYLIIDEYDNFANTILSTVGEKAFEGITHGGGLLRAFFNVVKGGASRTDAPISRLFITGVSPITLDDVTSGFNIATNISFEPDLSSMLGFTREDVIQMVDYYRHAGKIHHSTDEILEIMGRWYNHYRFSIDSDIDVFNTVHVLYFIQQYIFRSKIPTDLIDTNARFDYEKLRHLIVVDKKGSPKTNGNFSKLQTIIENQEIKTTIKTSFPVSALPLPSNFVSLLYYFGLLTIRGTDEEDSTILAIPNESVKHLYYDFIKAAYEETGVLTIDTDEYLERMKDMAFRGKWQSLVSYIAQQMEASLGLRDLMTGEKAMQVFWNVYLGLSTYYVVHIEKEMNQGFADIVMEPLLNRHAQINYSYLLEIKYVKPPAKKKEISRKTIDTLKEKAVRQLNTYQKDERFLKTIGKTELKKLILIFCGNRLISDTEV